MSLHLSDPGNPPLREIVVCKPFDGQASEGVLLVCHGVNRRLLPAGQIHGGAHQEDCWQVRRGRALAETTLVCGSLPVMKLGGVL